MAMYRTILACAQLAAGRLQIAGPTSFMGSTNNDYVLMLAMMARANQEIRNEYPWPELIREHTFTLSTDVASYALPGDFNRFVMESLWNRTQILPLMGPLDAVGWQLYKSGDLSPFPHQRFRVKGWKTNQFFIDPTPTSSEDGQTCVFEYVSTNSIRPKTWITGTAYTTSTYVSYENNIYISTNTATSGATPPTHTSGTVADGVGGVSWLFYGDEYLSPSVDTDIVLLDAYAFIDGTVWRFKQERGLDYQDLKQQNLSQLEMAKTRMSGAGVLSLRSYQADVPLIGLQSYPWGNYGV